MDDMEFKLGDPFFPYFRRMFLTRVFPILIVAVLVGVFIPSRGAEMSPVMMLVMGAVLTVAVGFGAWKGFQRQEAGFRAFRIRLDEGSIRRIQPGLPDIVIPKEGITRIVRVPGKGLTVIGSGLQNRIGIPETLEGFPIVEGTLEGWHPFEVQHRALASWIILLAGAGTVAASAVLFTSTNKILATACGGALLALMTYSAIVVPGSRHLDQRTKRAFWFMPVVILFIAVQIWRIWTR